LVHRLAGPDGGRIGMKTDPARRAMGRAGGQVAGPRG